MKLTEILQIIATVAKENDLTTPFICGGTPRDKILDKASDIKDVDITTGDETVHYLAKESSIRLAGPNTSFKLLDDGHAQLHVNGFKLDFSSNFRIPNVKEMLEKAGLKNPSDLQQELYSRDFTCNALLLSMDLKKISDPTGLGLKDIKARLVRTCLPAAITLGHDNKRVARIMYIAAKLNFDVDQEIIDWVRKNPDSLMNATPQYVIKKLKAAMRYDAPKTVQLLDKMDLWKKIPTFKELTPYMVKNINRI